MNPTTISRKNRFLYAAGNLGPGMLMQIPVLWLIYRYNPPAVENLPVYVVPSLLAVALVIGRGVDAVSDPLVGYWSDRTRTRWGRRKPFILLGALPMAVCFYLLWIPPVGETSIWNFIYVACIYSAFLFFYTVVVCPYLSLLPEIAVTSPQRISLARLQGFFDIIGVSMAGLAAPELIERAGYEVMAAIIGVTGFGAFLLPCFGEKERAPDPWVRPLGLRDAFKQSFANPHFRCYLLAYVSFYIGLIMLLAAVPYVVRVVIGLEKWAVRLLLTPAFISTLVCFPLVSELALARGKKFAILFGIALFAGTAPLLAVVGGSPTPEGRLTLATILVILWGPPMAAFFTLPNAIIADITTYDTSVTGRRREAIYFGMQGFAVKFSAGFGAALATKELEYFGVSESNPMGILLVGPFAALAALVAFFIFKRYSLAEARAPLGVIGVREVDAIILAGGKIREGMGREAGMKNKSFVPLLGKPSIEYVVEALEGTGRVRNIVAVGARTLGELVALSRVKVVAGGEDEAENLFAGVEALSTSGKILLVTSDSPLLTPQAINDFLDRCGQESEICYPCVTREVVEASFPGRKWTFVKLREGHFTGSNMALFEREAVLGNQRLISRLMRARRNILQAARIFGFLFMGIIAAGLGHYQYLERKAEALTGRRCQGVRSSFVELAMDIDTPEDVKLAERHLAQRGVERC